MQYRRFISLFLLSCLANFAYAQIEEHTNLNRFRQLYDVLPNPNVYRTASGAPGHAYWQQQVDYQIKIKLDDDRQQIYGQEVITYYNNSPDELTYLWLQLDQNRKAPQSDYLLTKDNGYSDYLPHDEVLDAHYNFDGGFKVEQITLPDGKDLPYTVNKTMMRIELPQALNTGEKFSFKVAWWYNINDRSKIDHRSGYEYFSEDDNYLYAIAQFYPRLCVYNDVEGWQNKQFLGRGEFTLEFGDFDVEITVPADHIVSATGELVNASEVLTQEQQSRLEKAKQADKPVLIVSQSEAEENESSHSKATKTWHFKAKQVRDFAFASSRKFIWDAMGVPLNGRTIMAMSFYPKEGNPLWGDYATPIVAHTVKVYSKYTFDYPYPVAQAIHTANIGMEYPMICFNGGRPGADGSYGRYVKYSMMSVIIHEVGHNFFPMIVNSDERQWSWMDEGLNTFLQYLTEQEWEPGYPSWAGSPQKIVSYMSLPKSTLTPIMSNSESIKLYNFGPNAYYKPTTALNILRETVMGHELFDYAFKTYAQRWKFRHPYPADFFRTMEDASAVDLDWFWRGWFYTTDHVDIAIKDVLVFKYGKERPDEHSALDVQLLDSKRFERSFADEFDKGDDFDIEDYYYVKIKFENLGGLVMPLIVKFIFTDGTSEIQRIPAEIWRINNHRVGKVFCVNKPVERIILDPDKETADIETDNNQWPQK